eukprot:7809136-Pyramimonas_sp.AAC.1
MATSGASSTARSAFSKNCLGADATRCRVFDAEEVPEQADLTDYEATSDRYAFSSFLQPLRDAEEAFESGKKLAAFTGH